MGRSATAFGVLLVFVLLAVVIFFMMRATGGEAGKAADLSKGTADSSKKAAPQAPAQKQGAGKIVASQRSAPKAPQTTPREIAPAPGAGGAGLDRQRSESPGTSVQPGRPVAPPPAPQSQPPSAPGSSQGLVYGPAAPPGGELNYFGDEARGSRTSPGPLNQPPPGTPRATGPQWPEVTPIGQLDRTGVEPAPIGPRASEPVHVMPAVVVGEKQGQPEYLPYTIRPGDSLWKLATVHFKDGSKWPEIVKANPGLPADGSRLPLGREIRIPILKKEEPPVEEVPKDVRLYEIKNGDTIWRIAKEFYNDVSPAVWKEILAANPGLDPGALRVGKKIRLPTLAGKGPKAVAEASPPSNG